MNKSRKGFICEDYSTGVTIPLIPPPPQIQLQTFVRAKKRYKKM